ncbi:MAG: macro domain-containing protein [Clostridia bacterium]|nr:macro domain-containing protein [Clostridia bacterium]
MPFEIVRDDLTNMSVDAIVNTANPMPIVGRGVDNGIHEAAGPGLLEARRKTGEIACGDAAVTPAFNLRSRYVIHTVGPVWKGGQCGEAALLGSCYRKSLELALANNCESVAFPLISTGNYGFPKDLAMQIAMGEFSRFLMHNDMHIYLVVFSKDAYDLSEKLFTSVKSYIDENYVHQKTEAEYTRGPARLFDRLFNRGNDRRSAPPTASPYCEGYASYESTEYDHQFTPQAAKEPNWSDMMKNLDSGFSETLLKLIDKSGKKDPEVYRKANVDRKTFSKIRNNPAYQPSKSTAIAFALALELSLEETKDFIARAGYALSKSNLRDVIIEYFIVNRQYDINLLNEVLFKYDLMLIGA